MNLDRLFLWWQKSKPVTAPLIENTRNLTMQTTDYEAGKQPLDPPFQPWTDGWQRFSFLNQPVVEEKYYRRSRSAFFEVSGLSHHSCSS
ncbi:MAG: hypothetical protein ACJAXW_000794 [Candidatus Azotimanducaceae bacterium]|jgi:hypothetical protein